MLSPLLTLAVVLASQLASGVYAMECSLGGLTLSCPTLFHQRDEAFCCTSSLDSRLGTCCNFSAYLENNSAMVAGILIAILVGIIIITLCCCCFCGCCCFAKRRMQQGNILYVPFTSDQHVLPSSSQNALSLNPIVPAPTNA